MKEIYKLSLGLLLLVVVSVFALKYAVIYLLPFLIAVLLASLIEPVVQFLHREASMSRGVSVAIVLLILIILVSLLVTVAFSRLFIELENLINNLPDYKVIGNKIKWLAEQNQELSRLIEEWEVPETVKNSINSNLQQVYDRVRQLIQLLIASLLGIIKKLPTLITTLFISIIATFFISRDKDLIITTYLSPFPEEWQKKIVQVQDRIISAAVGFIRALVILISMTTIIAILGLTILQSTYALVGGLATGILDLIPIIGPGMILIPWGIYSLIIGRAKFGIGVLILYAVITGVRQMAEAKIVGESIGIHPLATLLSMYLGIQLLGPTGLFIGPAALVVLKALLNTGVMPLIISEDE